MSQRQITNLSFYEGVTETLDNIIQEARDGKKD